MATPTNVFYEFELQDNRGFRSHVRFSAFITDTDGSTDTIGALASGTSGIGTALQAMTNAKVVKTGVSLSWDYAQEPSSATGTYELVQQGARLQGGDGAGGFMSVIIPAPKDALFETTTQDNLIVVKPDASALIALQAALAHTVLGVYPTPRGGSMFQQFFGGQLREGKARRRRVLQGA